MGLMQHRRQSDLYENVGEKYEGIFYELTFLPIPLSSSYRVPVLFQTQLVEERFILEGSKRGIENIIAYEKYTC